MKIDFPLFDSKIFLRVLTSKDVTTRYLSWLYDAEVTRYLEIRFSPPRNLEDLGCFINTVNDSDDSLMLGIFLRSDELHIGNIKLGPIDRNHAVGVIGLLIGDHAQWGKGYASMAIKLLSDYAFMKLGLIKLTAGCYGSNKGSHHAFLNAGFVEEGRLINQHSLSGQREDAVLLGKVNPSFEKLRK
jgi:[ribosomal protein S5]-alanine N-acetyltransferase